MIQPGTQFLFPMFDTMFEVDFYSKTLGMYSIHNIEPLKCPMDNPVIQAQVKSGYAVINEAEKVICAYLEADQVRAMVKAWRKKQDQKP